ncbi:hypothetical protein [Deinococcus sp. JMULE3]|nr:hypothetical protein [Deinococcus sp. JMULE3]
MTGASPLGSALFTDLYPLTMLQGDHAAGLHAQTASLRDRHGL